MKMSYFLFSLTATIIAGSLQANELVAFTNPEQISIQVTSPVTQPRAVALNNQVAEIRVSTDTDYLASSKTNETIPGVVTDGFTMVVIPKVVDDGSIIMRFNTLTLDDVKI